MPVVLKEHDRRLGAACREVERHCSGDDLGEIAVVVVANLDEVDGRAQKPHVRRSAAASDPEQAIVYVNDSLFWALSPEEHVAVLIHELGHFVRRGHESIECLRADCFACARGVEDALRALRGRTNGAHYRAILGEWRDPERVVRLFKHYQWHQMAPLPLPDPDVLARTPDEALINPDVDDLIRSAGDDESE